MQTDLTDNPIEHFLKRLMAATKKDSELEDVQSLSSIATQHQQLSRAAAILVMGQCLDKLAILKFKNNVKIEPVWNRPVKYRTLESRLTTDDENEEYKLFNYTSLKKMTKDLCFIYNTIESGMDQLAVKRSVTCIDEILDIIRTEKDEEDIFLIDHVNNLELLDRLKHEILKLPARHAKALDKKSDEVYHVQEKMEEILGYSLVEMKYLNRFEANRFYLKKLQNDQDEAKYRNILEDCAVKTQLENRVHHEIEIYMDSSRTERQVEIDYWMEHYDSETDRIDQQILDLNIQKEKLETDFEKLKKEYDRQKLAIEDWLELREKLKQAEELLRIKTVAATKIQAWWRGTMYRKHLGPYRKGKKGKKGVKKGKKKK